MKVITSESVFSGHPDKVCDQISDAILDAILEQDKNARVAVETAIKDDLVIVFGEVTTTAKVYYSDIAKKKLFEIGYEDSFVVIEKISKQSPDIALGVNSTDAHEQGAGDQGIMFGYACNETQEFMPLPIMYSNQISKEIDKLRKEKYSHIFGPDGKCQVSVAYENGKPKKVETIVVSAQTKSWVRREQYQDLIINEVLPKVFDEHTIKEAQILINPTGEFVVGVPGIMLIIKGKKVKAKSLKYKKYIQLIVNQQITDISQLAIYTGKSASEVLDDLREMISSGNLGSAVLDPSGMSVVLRRPAHATQNQQQPVFATNQDQVQATAQPIPTFTPTVIKCKACGADNFVDAPHTNCEYCGSPL